jgi:hypothetical protein
VCLTASRVFAPLCADPSAEASFQALVPAYVEDFAPPGKKALWLAVLYASIPTGSALGFAYGAMLAPPPMGWGWAYLFEAISMTPIAIGLAFLPSAEMIRQRRATAAAARQPLLTPPSTADAATASTTPPTLGSSYEGEQAESPLSIPEESLKPPSFLSQLIFLLTSPTFMLICLGYAAFTATVMALSVFAPLVLMGLGYFHEQTMASTVFGATAALAGILGTPLGGWVTDYATRSAARATAATNRNNGIHDDAGGIPDAMDCAEISTAKWRATLREARAILWAITLLIFAAGLLCVLSIVVLMQEPTAAFRILFLVVLCAAVTFSFATSAGISRAVMLVVPVRVRPFALALMSLLLHGLGDVPSPPIVGALIGAWAPNCSIIDVNRTTHAIIPDAGAGSDVEPIINPDCAAGSNSTRGDGYSPQQRGLTWSFMLAAVYMLTSVLWWGICIVVLTRRLRTEDTCPQPLTMKAKDDVLSARASVSTNSGGV